MEEVDGRKRKNQQKTSNTNETLFLTIRLKEIQVSISDFARKDI